MIREGMLTSVHFPFKMTGRYIIITIVHQSYAENSQEDSKPVVEYLSIKKIGMMIQACPKYALTCGWNR